MTPLVRGSPGPVAFEGMTLFSDEDLVVKVRLFMISAIRNGTCRSQVECFNGLLDATSSIMGQHRAGSGELAVLDDKEIVFRVRSFISGAVRNGIAASQTEAFNFVLRSMRSIIGLDRKIPSAR